MPRVGQNIRAMALQRRLKAVSLFIAAGLALGFPFLLRLLLQLVLTTPLTLPVWFYLVGLVVAIPAVMQGQYFWKRANQADQGAAGEEAIAAVLTPLQRQGWQIEYGVRDRSVGDIDVFLVSPQGNAYTIDVKSHRGRVVSDGKQLYRQYGSRRHGFEKDFLSQAKRQATAIKRLRQLDDVTAMIAFSDAQVEVRGAIADVYVVSKQELLNRLRSLDGDRPQQRR
jgi:Nuclease-related domain